MFNVNELKNKVLDGYEVTKEDAMNLIDVPFLSKRILELFLLALDLVQETEL